MATCIYMQQKYKGIFLKKRRALQVNNYIISFREKVHFASEVTFPGLSMKSWQGQSAAELWPPRRPGCCWQTQLVLRGHSPRRAVGALSTAGRTPGAPWGWWPELCCVVLLQLCRQGGICRCTQGGTIVGLCQWPLSAAPVQNLAFLPYPLWGLLCTAGCR